MFEGPRLGGLSCLALQDLQRPARSSAEELGLGGTGRCGVEQAGLFEGWDVRGYKRMVS